MSPATGGAREARVHEDEDEASPDPLGPETLGPVPLGPDTLGPDARDVSGADRRAIRAGLTVGLAAASYGVSYGALAVAAGLDIWQTCVMSLVMFTGGSQFALVGVIAAGGVAAGPSAIASAATLGVRNGIYGIRMAPILGGGRWRRIAAAWVTIDETTAVATNQPTLRSQRIGFWVTAAATFAGWNITSFIGALVGDALGDVRAYGLDAAAAAAFLGLLWPRLRQLQTIAVAAGAAVVAAALTPVLVPGLPVLVAGVVAVLVGVFNWFGGSPTEAAVTDDRRGSAAEGAPAQGAAAHAAPAQDAAAEGAPAEGAAAQGAPAQGDPTSGEEPT